MSTHAFDRCRRAAVMARPRFVVDPLESRVLFTVVGPFDTSTPVDIPVGDVKAGDEVRLTVNLSTTDPDDQSEGEPLIIEGSDGTQQTISTYGTQPATLDVSQDGETFDAYIVGADGDEEATITTGGAVDVERVWTTDSKNLMVQYDVTDNESDASFPIDVYRSDTDEFEQDADGQLPVASEDISGSDAATGDHTITIGSGGAYTFSEGSPLRPDPDYPYVIATADEDGTLSAADAEDPSQDSFRVWLVGAVSHGYSFGWLHEIGIAASAPIQTYVDTDAQNLIDDDGFDESIGFHWESTSTTPQPGQATNAGAALAQFVADAVSGAGAQRLSNGTYDTVHGSVDPAEDDVVDVDLIGHSRGGVVVSYALDDLPDDATNMPQLDAGFWMETLVDPHPASNDFGNNYSFAYSGLGLISRAKLRSFQALAQDPSAFVPDDVDAAVDIYQQTPTYEFVPGYQTIKNQESILNLWGESPAQIPNDSDSVLRPDPQTQFGLGHSEIQSKVLDGLIADGNALEALGINPFTHGDPLTITTPPPTTVTAGTPFSVTVTAENGDGTVNTGFNDPVTIASTYGNALGGTLTVAAVNGVATFAGLTDDKAGYDALDVTTATLPEVSTDYYTVDAGPAAALDVAGPNGSGTTNVVSSPFGLDVDVDDAFGNTVTSFTGNVTLALGSNPGNSTLGGTLTVAADDGEASFDGISVNNLGTGYTLVATSPGLASSTSVPFAISDQVAVTTAPPGTVTAGAPFGLTVAAEAGQGNVDAAYNGPITVALSNYSGTSQVYTLRGALTAQAVNGVATFAGLTEDVAGSFGLVISGANLASTSVLFNVAGAAASALVIAAAPAAATARVGFTVSVKAEDAFGNTDGNFTGPLALSATPTGGIAQSLGSVTAHAGKASFSRLMLAAGTYTLQVTGNGVTASTPAALTVSPAGVATQLVVTTPPDSTVTAGSAFPLVVQAEDGSGTLDATFAGTVTLSLSNSLVSAPLTGTVTVAAVGGVATFTGVVIDQAAGAYTLTAAAAGLAPVQTTTFAVAPAAAATLVIAGPTGNVLTNGTFGLTVNAEDPFGNVDANFNDSVTLALAANPGGATLGGTLTAYASSGVASFTGLTLSAAGAGYTLTATDAANTAVAAATSAAFAVNNDKLVLATQPPTILGVGATFGVTVQAQGATGTLDASFAGPVTLSLIPYGGTAGSLAGTVTVTAAGGVATFAGLSIGMAGRYGVVATSAGTARATSGTVVVAAIPTRLAFVVPPPAAITVGAPFAVSVEVEDAGGNLVTGYGGSATLSLGGGAGGTLGGTTTVSISGGVATLSGLTVPAAGTGYTLAAASGSLTAATSAAFDALPVGSATRLAISTQPPVTVAGNAGFGLTVLAQDSFGTTATSYAGPVTLTLGDNLLGGTLNGTVTVDAVAGVATFAGLTVYQSGSYTVTASGAALTAATSSAFTVTAPAATRLVVEAPSAAVVTNGPFDLTVDAEDPFGSVDANFAGSVSIALTSLNGATLGGPVTATAVGGVATFAGLTIGEAGGADEILATSAGLASGASPWFAVTDDQLVVTTQPASPSAGKPFGLTVTAETAAGAVDPTFAGPVTLTPSAAPDGTQPVLGGTFTRSAVGGTAAFFGLTLAEAGEYTVTATAGGAATGASPAFAVAGGQATGLVVVAQPQSPVTVGGAFSMTVAAEDASGNVDASFDGPVTLAVSAGPGTLGGTATVTAVGGIATFAALTLGTAGAGYALTATGDGFSVTTGAVDVTAAGVATQLAFTADPPASVTAGTAFGVTVAAVDSLGATDTSFTGAVTLSTPTSGAMLGGTLTVSAVAGVATFAGLTIDVSGYDYTLTASATGLASGAPSGSFDVTPAAASQLVVGSPQANIAPGDPFSLTVFAEDAFGNVDPTFDQTVTFALASTPGQTLGGTMAAAAVNGVAAFQALTLATDAPANTLQATAGALTGSTTVAADADELVVAASPPDEVTVNGAFGLSVSAVTATGAVDAAYTGAVTVSLLDLGSTGGTLAGTLTVTAVGGVATFGGLSIGVAGAYGLSVTAADAGGATSDPITVGPASPAASPIVPAFGRLKLPATTIAGQTFAVTLPVTLLAAVAPPAGKFTIYLYADASTTLAGQQVALGAFGQSVVLKAGKPRSVSLRLKSLPASLQAGTYHLLAEVVDHSGATSLVATAQTIQVVAPVVTLAVTVGPVSPKSAKVGKTVTVLVTVENTGNIIATGKLTVTLSASSDGTAAAVVSSLSTAPARTVHLAPGKHTVVPIKFKMSAALASPFYPFATATLDGASAMAAGPVS